MPYFNYSCDDCDERFEALSYQNGADVQCPVCDADRVTRQVGARVAVLTSVQRKGGVMDLSSGACPGCSNHGHH